MTQLPCDGSVACLCPLATGEGFCPAFRRLAAPYLPRAACPSQLRDCELAPGVNRDLARRVRNINGITQHRQVLRNDIKLSARLIHTLDERERLWGPRQRADAQGLEVWCCCDPGSPVGGSSEHMLRFV